MMHRAGDVNDTGDDVAGSSRDDLAAMQGGGIPPFPPAQLFAAKFYYSETLARGCFCRGTVFIHARF